MGEEPGCQWAVRNRTCSSQVKDKLTFPGEINNLGWASLRENKSRVADLSFTPAVHTFVPSWTNHIEEDSSWDVLVPF